MAVVCCAGAPAATSATTASASVWGKYLLTVACFPSVSPCWDGTAVVEGVPRTSWLYSCLRRCFLRRLPCRSPVSGPLTPSEPRVAHYTARVAVRLDLGRPALLLDWLAKKEGGRHLSCRPPRGYRSMLVPLLGSRLCNVGSPHSRGQMWPIDFGSLVYAR